MPDFTLMVMLSLQADMKFARNQSVSQNKRKAGRKYAFRTSKP